MSNIYIKIESIAPTVYDILTPVIWIEITILMIVYLISKHAQSIDHLTGFLVLLTAYYAWKTNNIVNEMKLVRLYQFIPVLKIKPTSLSAGNSLDIEIKNIGFGPAKDIRGVIRIEPDGEEMNIYYPLLYHREFFALQSPFTKVRTTEDVKKFKNIILDVTFMDIINNKTKSYDNFILEDINKIRNDSYERDKIAAELNKIGGKLDDIKSAISIQKR